MIYYHGETKWEFKQIGSFFESFPLVFKKHIPLFESLFISLKEMNEERIYSLKNVMLRAALMLQYDSNNPKKIVKNLTRILESLNPYLETNFLTSIFVYTLQTTEVKVKELKIILKELPSKLNNKVMSTYDMILEEGIEKGIEKGREEGRLESIINAYDNNYKLAELKLIFGISEEKIIEILKSKGRL